MIEPVTTLKQDVERMSQQLMRLDVDVQALRRAHDEFAGQRKVAHVIVALMAAGALAWVGWVSNVAISTQSATDVISAQRQETNRAILQRLDRIESRLERLAGE